MMEGWSGRSTFLRPGSYFNILSKPKPVFLCPFTIPNRLAVPGDKCIKYIFPLLVPAFDNL